MNDIRRDNCLVIGHFGDDTDSMADARQHWRKICSTLDSACHLITVAAAPEFDRPLDQNLNLVRGLADYLNGIQAHASVVINGAHFQSVLFNAAALRSLGINSHVFGTEEDARRWLETQPHRPDCPHAK